MAASGDEAAAAAGRADNVEAVGNSVDKEGEKMNGSRFNSPSENHDLPVLGV